jgi:hypothetical protein
MQLALWPPGQSVRSGAHAISEGTAGTAVAERPPSFERSNSSNSTSTFAWVSQVRCESAELAARAVWGAVVFALSSWMCGSLRA